MSRFVFALALTGLMASPAVPAFAAGDEPTTCRQGFVLDQRTKKCVRKTSAAPEAVLIDKGMRLAYAGNYDEAIAVLWQVEGWQDNPRALNYLGFAHRKSGDMDAALSYYQLALAADPDYTLARAYLGEGYLTLGRVDLAEDQLAEIVARDGTTGRAYDTLVEALATTRG